MRTLLDALFMRLGRRMREAQGNVRSSILLFLIGSTILGREVLAGALHRQGAAQGTGRRFVLFLLGVVALGASQSAGHQFGQHYWFGNGLLMAALLVAALLLFAAVAAPPLDLLLFRRSPRLIMATVGLCSIILGVNSSTQINRLADRIRLLPQHTQFGNDAVTMSSCATRLLLNGRNPYTDANIIRCLWEHGYYRDGSLTTPLQRGVFASVITYPSKASLDGELRRVGLRKIQHPLEFESQISYPAGSFLFPALAALLRIDDLRLFFALCFVGSYLFILARAPRRHWPWVLAIAFLNMAVWTNAVSGASDALYIAFVLVGWSLRRQAVPSAVAMGLAATARQQSWFFLLFYAVLIAQEYGPGELWRRGRIIGAIFLVTNLPFIVLSPGAWLSGIGSPLTDPMFPLGSGLIALALGASDAVPLAPRGIYTIMEVVTLALCLVYYARVCRRWPHLGLVLAVLPLFFAWRSLFSYFYPVTIPLLGALVEPTVEQPAQRTRTRRPRPRQMARRVAAATHLDLSA